MDRPDRQGRWHAAVRVAAMPLFVCLALIAAITVLQLLLLLVLAVAFEANGTPWFGVWSVAALVIAIANAVGATRAVIAPASRRCFATCPFNRCDRRFLADLARLTQRNATSTIASDPSSQSCAVRPNRAAMR